MQIKMPFQVVQNLRATHLILEAETKKAFDIMTRAQEEVGGSDLFCVFNDALTSLGVILDHHIEAVKHMTEPKAVTWAERIRRIPIMQKRPD